MIPPRFHLLAASGALLLAACATAPRSEPEPAPQPQPAAATTAAATAFDPVGTYSFSVDMQGNAINGTMTITRATDGRIGGDMTSDQGTLTFSSVVIEGKKVTASGLLQNGPELTFVMEFAGDDFSGTFSAQGTTAGTISGTRKKS